MSTQDTPVEAGHDDASREAKLAGLLAQVRADYQLGTTDDPSELLRTRLKDAQIEVDDVEFAAIAARVAE